MAALVMWRFSCLCHSEGCSPGCMVTPKYCAGTQQQCRSVVAALVLWKLSQYLCESCNFSSMVAVLAVLCVSALLQNQLRHNMCRSTFQHSFVINL